MHLTLGDKVVVGDPCYTEGDCKVIPVAGGSWRGEVAYMENEARIARLTIWSTTYLYGTTQEVYRLGVDSGQMSIVDADHRPFDEASLEYGQSDDEMLPSAKTWYRRQCDRTLSAPQWGGDKHGIVSSTGYGDGEYPCTVWYDSRGQAVKIEVLFDGFDERDDDEDADKYDRFNLTD